MDVYDEIADLAKAEKENRDMTEMCKSNPCCGNVNGECGGLPGLPVSKKAKTSAEAMKEATAKVRDSLDEAREALRAPFIKFAEDIKALEPLLEVMSDEHGRRFLAFLEAATSVMGEALKQEMENAFS